MIAVIADVHANLQAFTAVLEDAARYGVKDYWLVGDVVDYGANPNEVIALAKELPITRFVGGNHDAALFLDDIEASVTPHGKAAHAFTAAALAQEHRPWLERIARRSADNGKETRDASGADDTGGGCIRLVHGTPENPYWGKLRPDMEQNEIQNALAGFDAGVLLVGHSHVQFDITLDSGGKDGTRRRVCNPGSVGQPRNRCPQAQYMLIDGDEFVFRRVDYDIAGAAKAIRAAGLPEILAERLFVGR